MVALGSRRGRTASFEAATGRANFSVKRLSANRDINKQTSGGKTCGSGEATALHHPTFDSFAGLADVLGEQRTLLDTLEDPFGFLTICRCGITHKGNRIVH